ncbi:MAG TPA: GntR family transcriptional regulator [bacterium]|nr:GntR family transcriptional regulator [bacterium]
MQSPLRETIDFKTREQAAYETIRRDIIQGRWGPDESLVISTIAGELGVSRITVSNAIKRLAGEGFVGIAPHKEAVVARLDPEGVREIYLMRAELEALAGREAARRITPEALAGAHRLNAVVRERRAGLPDAIQALRAADRAFHRYVRSTAAMPRLDELLENLADQCEYYRSRLLDPTRLAAPDPQAHEVLLDALAAHDGEAAARVMRDHITAGMRTVLAALEYRR